MKIIKNTSLYDTKKLNSLFCLIHKQLAKYEGRLPHWSTLTVKLINRNGTYTIPQRDVSGKACVGKPSRFRRTDWHLRMSINKLADLEWIAQVFAHELMHSYGYHHHQYRKYPLEQHHLDEISKRFTRDDLLKPNALDEPKPRKKGISYKQKCKDLMKQFEWLVIERHNIEELREIEVYDDRDTCECYSMREVKDYHCTCDEVFDMRMDWRAENMNWCKAYENALLLILENDR